MVSTFCHSHRIRPLDISVFGPIKVYYKSQCSAWRKNNANKVLEIRHIAGLVCKTLDLALTPKTIKYGFAATGIQPFDPDIFTDADFVQAVQQNAKEVEADAGLDEDEQRRIAVDSLNIGREERCSNIPISFAFSYGSTSVSSLLDEIRPLQAATPKKKKSKRGRKAMEGCELTSAETRAILKEAAAARTTKAAGVTPKKATPPAKRPKAKKQSLCIICLWFLPKKLTAANSIKCTTCQHPVHLECADMGSRSVFTCKHCYSHLDNEEDDY